MLCRAGQTVRHGTLLSAKQGNPIVSAGRDLKPEKPCTQGYVSTPARGDGSFYSSSPIGAYPALMTSLTTAAVDNPCSQGKDSDRQHGLKGVHPLIPARGGGTLNGREYLGGDLPLIPALRGNTVPAAKRRFAQRAAQRPCIEVNPVMGCTWETVFPVDIADRHGGFGCQCALEPDHAVAHCLSCLCFRSRENFTNAAIQFWSALPLCRFPFITEETFKR